MEMVEETWKIADALNLLASQSTLRKSIILAPSSKGYTEFWWKKPSDFEKEKSKRTIGGQRSNSQAT